MKSLARLKQQAHASSIPPNAMTCISHIICLTCLGSTPSVPHAKASSEIQGQLDIFSSVHSYLQELFARLELFF